MKLLSALKKVASRLSQTLFPPLCLNCQKTREADRADTGFICEQCRATIRLHSSFFCPVCGLRLAENKQVCSHRAGFLLAAATDYSIPAVRSLIHGLKFRSFKKIENELTSPIEKYLTAINFDFQKFIVAPIPLNRSKLNRRGFNQAAVIAEIVSRKLSLPAIDALVRIKNTQPQSKFKKRAERLENVAGCFAAGEKLAIAGKNIILTDDVFTTGATAREAVKVLKAGGARKIIVFVFAKA